MALWLVYSSLDWVVQIRALARDIVLCSNARLHSHSASIHPSVQMGTGKLNAGDNPLMD